MSAFAPLVGLRGGQSELAVTETHGRACAFAQGTADLLHVATDLGHERYGPPGSGLRPPRGPNFSQAKLGPPSRGAHRERRSHTSPIHAPPSCGRYMPTTANKFSAVGSSAHPTSGTLLNSGNTRACYRS